MAAPLAAVDRPQFVRPVVRVGVIADTHVPDRLNALPPSLFELLSGVDLLLHAGDLSRPGVLDELGRLAPVLAVQGNRDIFYKTNRILPLHRIVEIGSIRIGLTHGHGGLAEYIKEKFLFLTTGAYRYSRYEKLVRRLFDGVQVIVFGHTHLPICKPVEGVLLFNPGSVGPDYKLRIGASVGLLTVDRTAGTVRGQILPLPML